MKVLFTLLISIVLALPSFSQIQETKHTNFYRTVEIELDEDKIYRLTLNAPISSVSIELLANQDFQDFTLFTSKGSFVLTKDLHTEANFSNLIVFDQPIMEFSILGSETNARLKLHLIYVPPLQKEQKIWEKTIYRTENECDKPNVVLGSQWRVGLPPPKNSPTSTEVKHIIIHHSAGSNTATNFMEEVRNIYILHTQSNGWNDIGYNYLIAQDGTIFEGRQGQGALESDNVLGAHFCGKNAGTMGICLLGNYQSATSPTQATLISLYKLIAWKLKKENLLNPFASFAHPPNVSNASMLGVISGHRDGCGTDCPGENVYKQLEQIKMQVATSCTVLGEEENFFDDILKIYPQPSSNEVFISSEKIIDKIILQDLVGRELTEIYLGNRVGNIDLTNYSSGIYIIKIAQEGKVKTKKLVIDK